MDCLSSPDGVGARVGDRSPVRPPRASVYVLAVVLIAGLVAAVASLAVYREFAQYREQTLTTTMNTARLIDQVVESMFAKVDVSLQTSARFYLDRLGQRRPAGLAVEPFLAEQRRLHPEIISLRITDAAGAVIHGLDPGEQAVNLADRSFFKAARSNADDRLIVAGPVLARIAQKWVLVLARRLQDGQGRFVGMVYANIAVASFQAPLSRVDLGPHGAATLRTSELALVFRVPESADTIGSTRVSADLAAIIQAGRQQGSYVAATALDGIERINAYRRIGTHPVYVIVGAAPRDRHGDIASSIALIGVLSLVALGVLLAGARVVWQTTARLHADLAIRERLEASLRQAQQISRLGNWVCDARTGKCSWSAVLHDIFRLDPSGPALPFAAMEPYFEPASWSRLKRAVQDCATLGTPYDLDGQIIRADGESAWIHAKGAARRSDEGEIVELHGTVQDISERKQLELALGRANEELDDLYNGVPCGYHSVDSSGRYVRINATMLSWIGCSLDEAIGKLGPRDSFSEAGRAKFDSNFPSFLKTGRVRALEFELVHRSGQRRTVSVSASAIYDAQGRFKMSRSVMFDVTELRRAQAQVSEIRSTQDAMLNNQRVGVARLRDRQFTWVNTTLCDLFGYRAAELEGRSSRLLYADDASFEALGRDAYPRLMAGESFHTRLQVRRQDGRLVWIDLQGVLVDAASRESLWMLADITDLLRRQEQFEFNARHDALTGLVNRSLLDKLIPQALDRARRQGTHVAVCYLDLDRFKPVNDRHGHAVGDEVLKDVGRRLLQSVGEADVVARIGGDEFVLLLTGLDDAQGHRPVCERARAAISRPIMMAGQRLSVGVAIGVAVFPVDGDDPESLRMLADERMYLDKASRDLPSGPAG
ncbi:PAS domain S-box-containing protein/diguanylate cyclase (GGDEF)-like protein [Sphaerotilus hippei]|uniref:PAS domain S-box-containing protein/diguanylate cyclase (GGDEF)-like protein n=1 Tax=Sphaerotilus hippei TaxID=744406 RepID=A0A318GYQ9_9BURK|nr:diguanylate cyclase [Sphaerotilus hippei]PXW95204.1 PAS domain S-box-containing protein/diguanylate cyclase (GGDEF)-like protein [Sphaerotilus hippei]